jgi:hypothetical protein
LGDLSVLSNLKSQMENKERGGKDTDSAE